MVESLCRKTGAEDRSRIQKCDLHQQRGRSGSLGIDESGSKSLVERGTIQARSSAACKEKQTQGIVEHFVVNRQGGGVRAFRCLPCLLQSFPDLDSIPRGASERLPGRACVPEGKVMTKSSWLLLLTAWQQICPVYGPGRKPVYVLARKWIARDELDARSRPSCITHPRFLGYCA